jgi:DNA-binding transcriptional MerR regulator
VSVYRISELTRRTGVSASTLRFYEQAGLLSAARTASGYRVYDEQAVRRLEFVGAAKLLGLPLEEIRELLGVWEDGECVHVRAKLRPLIATRIAEAQRRIAELTAFAAHLERVHDELGGAAPRPRPARSTTLRRVASDLLLCTEEHGRTDYCGLTVSVSGSIPVSRTTISAAWARYFFPGIRCLRATNTQ